jgi:hypothetical protein
MKKIKTTVLFNNQPVAEVESIHPFEELIIHGEDVLVPESFWVFEEGEQKLITKEKPKEFIMKLRNALTGSYVRATKAEVIDDDD